MASYLREQWLFIVRAVKTSNPTAFRESVLVTQRNFVSVGYAANRSVVYKKQGTGNNSEKW
jgi:hypothetical protein